MPQQAAIANIVHDQGPQFVDAFGIQRPVLVQILVGAPPLEDLVTS